MSTNLGQDQVIAKDDKSCTYCCYVRCAKLIVIVGGMPWTQTGETHAELVLPDKGHTIIGLVVCYVVVLGSMKGIGHVRSTECSLVSWCGRNDYRAQVPQQHPIETLHKDKYLCWQKCSFSSWSTNTLDIDI